MRVRNRSFVARLILAVGLLVAGSSSAWAFAYTASTTHSPEPAAAGQPVTFTFTLKQGVSSVINGPPALSVTFDPGDGSGPVSLMVETGDTITHTYAQPGNYTATSTGNATPLSDSVTVVVGPATADTAGVQSFVEDRNRLLTSDLQTPGLDDRSGGGSVGGPDGSSVLNFTSSSLGSADDAILGITGGEGGRQQPYRFWLDGHFRLHSDGDENGVFGLAGTGGDYLVNKDFLLGAALYIDYMTTNSATASISGIGAMAGPYMSVRLSDGVTLDASLFYGRSWNQISTVLSGTNFSGSFQTDRWLAKAKLQGTWNLDALRVLPEATFFLSQESTGDFSVSDGTGGTTTITASSILQLRLGTGLTLETDLAVGDNAVLTPSAGFRIGVEPTAGTPLYGLYGDLFAGLSLRSGHVVLSGNVDGTIDSSGFKSIGVDASVKGEF